MSFGRPGGALDSFRVLPPDRGSFPLDNDGEFLYIIYNTHRSSQPIVAYRTSNSDNAMSVLDPSGQQLIYR